MKEGAQSAQLVTLLQFVCCHCGSRCQKSQEMWAYHQAMLIGEASRYGVMNGICIAFML